MRTKTLILLSAVLLLIVPGCKQHGKWTKHVVTEEYTYVDGQNQAEEEQAEAPSLWNFTAKRMVKAALKEKKVINSPVVVPVKLGYYECNDLQERENLYKAQVNGLLDVKYSEIKNKHEKPTYWVEVALTPKGKSLVVKDDKPVFPEDTINHEHMLAVLSPESGLNQYGEYTFDPNVDNDVIELIKSFYNAYIANKNMAINNYGTHDLIDAQQRINTAQELGVRRMQDPFLRGAVIDSSNVNDLYIDKWTSFVDLYVASIGEAQFCIVVKNADGVKKIDDVALNAPSYLNVNKTLRCTAKGISARELHNALKAKQNQRPAAAPKKAPAKAAPVERDEPEPSLLFDEYMPYLQPGIELAEHAEPTPYQLAKQCEHIEIVNMLAGEYQFEKMSKLKNVKVGKNEAPVKTAIVTIKRAKVSPLGRIFFNMKEGETDKFNVAFSYKDEEWNCEVALK